MSDKMTDEQVRAELERIEPVFRTRWDIEAKSNLHDPALRLLAELHAALGEIIPLALKIKENDEDSDSYEIHCNADFIVEIARTAWKGK